MLKPLSLKQACKYFNVEPEIFKKMVKTESLIGVSYRYGKYFINTRELAEFSKYKRRIK